MSEDSKDSDRPEKYSITTDAVTRFFISPVFHVQIKQGDRLCYKFSDKKFLGVVSDIENILLNDPYQQIDPHALIDFPRCSQGLSELVDDEAITILHHFIGLYNRNNLMDK